MRILVIRRDNIGDLVCTTPLLAALRERYPAAHIAALVNSYNAAVLDGNPHVDEVHRYTKLKHRSPGESAAAIVLARLKMMARLRRQLTAGFACAHMDGDPYRTLPECGPCKPCTPRFRA